MRIDVVAPDDDVWPLPWYLRRFDGAGVHYRRDLSSELDARVVVAHQGVNTESLPGRYISMASYGLRPDVRVTVWVYRELWQEYLNRVE